MRDVIWTLIVIWLVYKLVGIFKTKPNPSNSFQSQENTNSSQNESSPSETKIKKAVQDHLNKEGEYIDFEEIK